MSQSYDYVPLYMPFFDIPVSLGDLSQWIASTLSLNKNGLLSEYMKIFLNVFDVQIHNPNIKIT